jgi:hypothetical protein
MLAELPMTMASNLVARRPLASATSVCSEMSEDVSPVLPASDEHGPTCRREQESAHDHAQVAGIDVGKLGRQALAHLSDPGGELVCDPSAWHPPDAS